MTSLTPSRAAWAILVAAALPLGCAGTDSPSAAQSRSVDGSRSAPIEERKVAGPSDRASALTEDPARTSPGGTAPTTPSTFSPMDGGSDPGASPAAPGDSAAPDFPGALARRPSPGYRVDRVLLGYQHDLMTCRLIPIYQTVIVADDQAPIGKEPAFPSPDVLKPPPPEPHRPGEPDRPVPIPVPVGR